MSSEVVAALVGAVVGGAIALGGTWFLEYLRIRARRRHVATALVLELRNTRRNLEEMLLLLTKHTVRFTSDFSETVQEAVLSDLPDLGGDVFVGVRTLFAQLRNVNYLRAEAAKALAGDQPLPGGTNVFDALTSTVQNAILVLDATLRSLRCRAPSSAFSEPLLELPHLSQVEHELFSGDRGPESKNG
jgi:hypothetical protein